MFSKIPFSRLIQLYELSWPPRSTSKGYLFNLSTKIPRPFSRVITVNYMPVISMSSWSYFNVHYFALVGITFHLPLCWPLAELYAMQSSSVIIFLNKCIIWKFITFCLFFSTIQDTLTRWRQIICTSIKASLKARNWKAIWLLSFWGHIWLEKYRTLIRWSNPFPNWFNSPKFSYRQKSSFYILCLKTWDACPYAIHIHESSMLTSQLLCSLY